MSKELNSIIDSLMYLEKNKGNVEDTFNVVNNIYDDLTTYLIEFGFSVLNGDIVLAASKQDKEKFVSVLKSKLFGAALNCDMSLIQFIDNNFSDYITLTSTELNTLVQNADIMSLYVLLREKAINPYDVLSLFHNTLSAVTLAKLMRVDENFLEDFINDKRAYSHGDEECTLMEEVAVIVSNSLKDLDPYEFVEKVLPKIACLSSKYRYKKEDFKRKYILNNLGCCIECLSASEVRQKIENGDVIVYRDVESLLYYIVEACKDGDVNYAIALLECINFTRDSANALLALLQDLEDTYDNTDVFDVIKIYTQEFCSEVVKHK